jgi:hypothetical protein
VTLFEQRLTVGGRGEGGQDDDGHKKSKG